MHKRLLTLFVALTLVANTFAQSKIPVKAPTATLKAATANSTAGYNIPVTITPLKNTWVYLGCHFGKYKNLVDSAWLNAQSQGVFKGKAKLPQGIYLMVSPNKVLMFEFLMDKGQHFTVKSDTSHLETVTITGSVENQVFQQYTQFLTQKAPVLSQMQKQLTSGTLSNKDSILLREALNKGNKELQDYREKLVADHPNSMLATFFNTMRRPEVPAIPKLANGKSDSTYPYHFVKEHWWDGVSFDDESLVRTPFFEPKLEEYFKYYVVPEADSIIPEVNYMLLVSRNSPEIFKYLLGKFTDKYINPEYMGQEKVFLHLFDKYYSKGDTLWLNEKQRKYIFDRAYSLMANQLNEPAADLDMLDTAGKKETLYEVKAPFTFISFYDPNCGHCKETIPRIDSIYRAKWKGLGVKLVGVNVDEGAMDAWKSFIREHKLEGWLHIYQPKNKREAESKNGVANYRQLYDVFKTPTLYLLDDQKRIIGKMLTIEQFDEVLQAKLKTKTTATK